MKRTACFRAAALALVLVLLAGMLPAAASAAGSTRFDDVQPTDWFYSAVETICGKSLMAGTADRTFSPDRPVTRGMLATILYRLENCPKIASGSPFADVPAGSYYEKAIRWAAANQIVTGYDAAHFGPDDALTREQLAVMLYRYADAMGYDVSGRRSHTLYADAADVSAYAQRAVDWAIAEGFLKGKDGWKLCPKAAATRAQTAEILARFCTYAEQQAAARLSTILTATAHHPENGLSIRFDQAETVTTQPTVTLGGSYVSETEVASITYTLTGEYSDFLDAAGDVTYADGRWEIPDLRVVPDRSTVTLVITDADGNTASAVGSVCYDLGELVDPELVEVAQDEETGLIFASNILLVYFADEASDADKAAVAQSVGGTVVGQDNFMNMQQLMVEPVTLEEANQIADQVETDFPETVIMAMFDLGFTSSSLAFDDPWVVKETDPQDGKVMYYIPEGWNENNPKGTNWGLEAIEALSAWELYGAEFKPIRVGVVDTVFDTTHEDLNGKIVFPEFPNRNAERRNNRNLKSFPNNSHGTHVAGIIAATANNGIGITGVAHNAQIVAYPYAEIVKDGNLAGATEAEFTSELENGLILTVLYGAKVVNFSVSLTGNVYYRKLISPSFKKLVSKSAQSSCRAMSLLLENGMDFLVVQAAGNGTKEGTACDAVNGGAFASISQENKLLTGNVTLDQVLDRIIVVGNAEMDTPEGGVYEGSRYIQNITSNAGKRVDLCAPGTKIASCFRTDAGERYGFMTGTSQAAPYVTGVAALVWSANDALTGPQVKQILCSSYLDWAKDNMEVTWDHNSLFTGGTFPMVNARLSVKKALEMKYGTTKNYRATIVEGPTAAGLKASSVTARLIDSTDPDKGNDPMKCRVQLIVNWSQNTSMYATEGVERHVGRSFTQAEINAAIAGFRKGRLPEDLPLATETGEEFEWSRAQNQYPIYELLLHIDRAYNVLGYTIVKIEQA